MEPGTFLGWLRGLFGVAGWIVRLRSRTQEKLDQAHTRILAEEAADNLLAMRDAPAILERWIDEALAEAAHVYENSALLERSRDFRKRVTITNASELAAARRARQHGKITRLTVDPNRIGETLEMYVSNPRRQRF